MVRGKDMWPAAIVAGLSEKKIGNQIIETYECEFGSMYDVLRDSARRYRDKTALVGDDDQSYSYARVLELSDKLAAYFYYEKRVQKGDRVALMLYNGIEFCTAFFAFCKLGAVVVPLPTKYKKDEILSLLGKVNPELILSEEKYLSWFEEYEQRGTPVMRVMDCNPGEYGFSYLLQEGCEDCKAAGELEDPVIIMFTSGTTSQSKGALIRNYNVLHSVISYCRILGITEKDKTVISIPIYHITGLVALLSLFVYAGGTTWLHGKFDAKRVLRCVEKEQITFIHAAPTIFSLLLEEREFFPQLSSLRAYACGSANMAKDKLKQLHQWTPNARFHTVYGLTETTSPGTIFPDDAKISPYIGSSGRLIPGLDAKITNDRGDELPAEGVGEIVLHGAAVIQSYLDNGNEAIRDGWFSTGDLGYFNREGFLYIMDRKKDMINRGGEKIWSFDIENEIYAIPGVAEAAVVSKPNDIYGEVAVAAVVREENAELTERDILEYLSTRLAGFQRPTEILFMDKLPKTANEKINKREIRKMFL